MTELTIRVPDKEVPHLKRVLSKIENLANRGASPELRQRVIDAMEAPVGEYVHCVSCGKVFSKVSTRNLFHTTACRKKFEDEVKRKDIDYAGLLKELNESA
jgi:hypothetical protein